MEYHSVILNKLLKLHMQQHRLLETVLCKRSATKAMHCMIPFTGNAREAKLIYGDIKQITGHLCVGTVGGN